MWRAERCAVQCMKSVCIHQDSLAQNHGIVQWCIQRSRCGIARCKDGWKVKSSESRAPPRMHLLAVGGMQHWNALVRRPAVAQCSKV